MKMKISISTILFLLGFTITAQNTSSKLPINPETNKIEFQEVVDQDGTKGELFNRSVYWLNDFYKDPVNNRPKFIGTAIESVLEQSIQDVEVIAVVNGGPDDPTIPAIQEYMAGGKKYNSDKPDVKLIVLDVNNIGMCLNLGAKTARGRYYVQLDSDDRLKPNAVEKIMEIYESDSRIGMVIGSYEVWQLDDQSGKIEKVDSIPVVTHDEWTEENGRNNLLRINGAGAPRSIPINIIKEIGYFGINDEPFARNYGEDYEMVLKISEKYRIGRVWDPIYDVVRHSGGTDHSIDQNTIDRNDEAKDYMREQAILRRIKMNQ